MHSNGGAPLSNTPPPALMQVTQTTAASFMRRFAPAASAEFAMSIVTPRSSGRTLSMLPTADSIGNGHQFRHRLRRASNEQENDQVPAEEQQRWLNGYMQMMA
jgi:hypothetical protein